MYRPGPRTLRQTRYCVIHQNASSPSPRDHLYTRQPIICLPTDAHGCYNTVGQPAHVRGWIQFTIHAGPCTARGVR
jgi:hypothetical protein